MKTHLIVLAAGAMVAAACSEVGGPGSTAGLTPVSFAISTRPTSSAPSVMAAESFNDGNGNTLTVDSAFVVVRKLRLEGGPTAACAPDSSGDMGPDDSLGIHDSTDVHDSTGMEHDSMGTAPIFRDGGGDDGCDGLKLGPFLVELPLTGGAAQQFTVSVDSGTYTSVMFQIHRPVGAADTAFVAAHPDYNGVSIRVFGHWNGAPFDFTTGVTDVQHVEFNPPLVIGAAPTTFTLSVDLSGWFRAPDSTLVDPMTALDDSTNAPLVRGNILRSFHAFRDDNHDGEDDHLEH